MSDFGTQTGRKTLSLRRLVLLFAMQTIGSRRGAAFTRYDQRCLNVEENGNVLPDSKWHPLSMLNDSSLRDELRLVLTQVDLRYMSVCQALDRQSLDAIDLPVLRLISQVQFTWRP